MKHSSLFFLALMFPLAACAADGPLVLTPVRAGGAVGGDSDAKGCIASAGYSWCARTNQCERPWELASSAGFPNSAEGFSKYCGTPAAAPAGSPAKPAASSPAKPAASGPAKQSGLPGQAPQA